MKENKKIFKQKIFNKEKKMFNYKKKTFQQKKFQ